MVKYKAYNEKLDQTIEVDFQDDLEQIINQKGWEGGDYHVWKLFTCRGDGCEISETMERFDYYGITTGHFCNECYENNYPYKKDRYPTIEYDGYGERLNPDY